MVEAVAMREIKNMLEEYRFRRWRWPKPKPKRCKRRHRRFPSLYKRPKNALKSRRMKR